MNTSGIHIRPGTRADVDTIASLLTASALPLDGVSADAVDDGTIRFVIAEDNGSVVGVGAVESCGDSGTYGLLRSIAVDTRAQRSGIGRAIVEHAIDRARANGIAELFLLTTTAADYFPKFGFEQIQRGQVPADVQTNVEFTSACPASATVMRLVLTPA